ncbi:methyltransferase domain-containing protein [Pelagibacterales bacterium SAG-MED39]|nr:methyltransferase domain-containing protein [Pelagibacterales bacterium SAG-MED39]
MSCKNCKSRFLKKIINIGKQPISSHFYKKKIDKLKNYSLDLYVCLKCNLVQFKSLAKLDHMYGLNYGYRTSLSPLMINHMKDKYLRIKNDLKNKKRNILDIGCNDGTFLNFFKKFKNINLFGIDPSAEKFKRYHSKKINLIVDYFKKKNVEKKFNNVKFDLITSFAMFYDIEDPNSFCKDIKNLLTKNGKWILELSYFPLLLQNLTYDQICHEHVTYYTLTTFEKIIKKNGLKILDFSLNNINGGSIEIICSKKNSNHSTNIKKINTQKKFETYINDESYKNFDIRTENIKKMLNLFLDTNKGDVIGYGASTKGNIVLNHCGVDNKKLKYICDANPYKFNRFTPGSNIKIISKEKMRKLKPKYLLVLIWSFRKEVIQQEKKFIDNGGKLIFHLPMFHIIDKNNYKRFMNNNFQSLSYNF